MAGPGDPSGACDRRRSAQCSAPTRSTRSTAETRRCGRTTLLPPTRPRSYHSILELGMLGTGIPSGDRRQARRSRPRGRVRHRRRRRGVQRHGAADRRARAACAHRDRLRRGLLDDGGAQRAGSSTERRSGRLRARSAGTSSRRASAATASTSTGSRTSSRRCARAQAHDGPSLLCLRTDHDANLNIPRR